MREEVTAIQWNNFDKVVLSWSIVGSLVYVTQHASLNAVVLKSGVMYDSIGMYWLFRQAVRDWEDVFQSIKLFAFFAIISAPLIVLEKFQDSSLFSVFGDAGGRFHRGRFRAAGPFPHYIIMGCFWASLLPFFYAQIKARKDKKLYWIAIIASLASIYASASSTPLLTLMAIILFWKIYNYRMHGNIIFGGICFVLVFLHLIMKAPVWHLMSRIDIFEGSTGWHRYFLFDNFIKNTWEWFFWGTKSTAHWGHVQWDLTNQFIVEGVRGGIVTLVIFSIMIFASIRIPCNFSLIEETHNIKWIAWGLCVAMVGHFFSFWGVSYFGQINMLFFFTLALVGFVFEKSIMKYPDDKKRRLMHRRKILRNRCKAVINQTASP